MKRYRSFQLRLIGAAILLTTLLLFPSGSFAEEDNLFNIKDYRGKAVYLDFWASWCGPCRASFPWMEEMRKKYSRDGLEIITVNLDKKRELAEKFIEENSGQNLKVIYDRDAVLAKRYLVEGMPTTIIFNRAGEPVSRHIGFLLKERDKYESEIVKLLTK